MGSCLWFFQNHTWALPVPMYKSYFPPPTTTTTTTTTRVTSRPAGLRPQVKIVSKCYGMSFPLHASICDWFFSKTRWIPHRVSTLGRGLSVRREEAGGVREVKENVTTCPSSYFPPSHGGSTTGPFPLGSSLIARLVVVGMVGWCWRRRPGASKKGGNGLGKDEGLWWSGGESAPSLTSSTNMTRP